MPAPDRIKQLVENFELHRREYLAGKYNETQLRREFLDPFFEALGWDVFNKLGYSEENKHVIHEDSLEIEGVKKAPDYAFKIGKERKFFVEAKKPFVKIETNPEFAFQLRRYVWSAKLPLGILTDFEEFAVYECRSKPTPADKVKSGRVLLLSYKDYIEKWDEIASIFSYDAVMQGKFDVFANSAAKKKGTAEVDDVFLAEIEGWREALAKNLALRNKPRVENERDLNYAVQMIIDRIIFLRICEDRGFESENQLQEIALTRPSDTLSQNGRGIYAELVKLFERADRRYNSGLFHFKAEKGRGHADTFTTTLEIDDKVLKDILKDLYYPAPYVFSQIPADILGQIYEQFLGKVIRLTASHQAKVEEKPEVRKAGGVYYTPTFIVSYIVINTLGKLLLGLTPKEAARLKILDPACGSGTFLLGVFQYLLDWHLQWYKEHDPEKWAKGKDASIYQSKDGWKLTTAKKKEILLNNIYGVDIDAQAVEVTKLSLLLKVIEDPGQLSMLDERILPDLGKNIQCGNSLIGPDYWDGQLLVDEAERARVNAFDWKAAFPEVFSQGGFDAVVGNPPYIHSRSDQFDENEKAYYFRSYKVAEYQVNTFAMFLERCFTLLRPNGLLGMIIPNYWLSTQFDKKLRDFLFFENSVREILNVYSVFADATVDTLILVGERTEKDTYPKKVNIKSISRNLRSISQRLNAIHEAQWEYFETNIIERGSTDVAISFSKDLNLHGDNTLGDYFEMKFGMKPYQVGKGNPSQTQKIVDEKGFDAKEQINKDYLPLLKARNVKRYRMNWQGDWIRYGVHLAEPRTSSLFNGERILIQRIVSGQCLDGVYTSENFICNTDVITLKPREELKDFHLYFFLGLLLSRPIGFYLKSQNVNLDRTTFPKINTKTLNTLPIPNLNFTDLAEKAQHNKMVSLVERMLALHKSLASAHTPSEKDRLMREVESADKSIDGLVYELYGLTEEEIKIVES